MSETDDPKINDEAAERIADLALETSRRQLSNWNSLDAKAWQVFGSGSVILGLGIAGRIGGIGLAVGLAAYGLVALGSLRALYVRKSKALPPTEPLWGAYWFRPRHEVNNAVITALCEAEKTNADHLENKGDWLKLAMVALAAETAILAITAAVS